MKAKHADPWSDFPALSEDEYIERMIGEKYLNQALSRCTPTRRLIRRCYRALAKAGVEPLPVPNALDA